MPENPLNQEREISEKEKRIRQITQLYYSKPEVQNAIFEFSKNREISPRYFEGFGKRPDSFQYKADIFQMVKKGATSFHCSEELWKNPLELSTDLNEQQLNELRAGWDFLIDIDSPYLDYSKVLAKLIIKFLKFHGIKNLGLKFSGSKGFHLIIPYKAFPKEINQINVSDMFPQWPRIILNYINEKTKPELIKKITEMTTGSKYVQDKISAKEVIPDLILVSPRHLFRMPYSLHEKTALASIVIEPEQLDNFQPKDADPMKIQIKDFIPDAIEGEATELLIHALDWYKESHIEEDSSSKKRIQKEFQPVKLENLSDKNFPPCIQKILQGLSDGKKRAFFALINFFRSVGIERDELEHRIEEWNKKNEIPLKHTLIKPRLTWEYKRKPVMPPNCKQFYQDIGVCIPDDFCKLIKNPGSYTIRKTLRENNQDKTKSKNSNKFKNNKI